MPAERPGRNMPIMAKNDDTRRGLWDLARAHRILDLEGHNDMSLGHCSMRDPWERGVWLKRGNIGLEEVHEEDFILLDFDGNITAGEGVRHLEWPIHTEVLRARPDLNFVCHTHPHWATLFSCTREKLAPLTNEGCWFTAPPPHYLTTSDLIDSPQLGKDLAECLGRGEAAFLRNHGILSVGRTGRPAQPTAGTAGEGASVKGAVARRDLRGGGRRGEAGAGRSRPQNHAPAGRGEEKKKKETPTKAANKKK